MHSLGEDRSLLHRARCHHLHPPDTTKVHTTAYPKACANDLDEAPPWVSAAGSEIELGASCIA